MAQQSNVFNQEQDKDKQQQQQPEVSQPQVLSSGPMSSPGRASNFSSGSTPNAQGSSGRFTNLKNYMGANTQATQNLGAKANETISSGFKKSKDELSNQNQQIANTFQNANSTLQSGSGFKSDLENVNKDLNTGFQDFFNRDQFDTAAQRALSLAGNKDYLSIASGSGFDENATKKAQEAAKQLSSGVLTNTQKNLSGIETEQGRDQLFSQVLKPKQGYSQGNRAFDTLFLGGALNDIRGNLQTNLNEANKLNATTLAQDTTLNDLTSREQTLLGGLTDLNKQNFDIFEKKFGDQANIDLVNKEREARYNRVADTLKGVEGAKGLTVEDAELLGLDPNTFINQNQQQVSGKISSVPENYSVGTYNLLNNSDDVVAKFLKKGREASNLKDITSQQDLDAYQALAKLANKSGGLLTGVSDLGASFSKGDRDLGAEVAAADKAFRDKYAGKNYNAGAALSGANAYKDVDSYYNSPTAGLPGDMYSANPFKSNVNQTESFSNNSGGDINELNRRQLEILNPIAQKTVLGTAGLDVASAVAQQSLEDYLRSGNTIKNVASGTTKADNPDGDSNYEKNYLKNKNYLENIAKGTATNTLKNNLENILKTEGVRNQLSVDTSNPDQYKRFKGLV